MQPVSATGLPAMKEIATPDFQTQDDEKVVAL
jgi:hypothetical protein